MGGSHAISSRGRVRVGLGSAWWRTTVYAFTGPAVEVPKESLAADPAVWEVHPGRLVVFTCNRNDRAYNIVFTAEFVAALAAAS